MAETLITRLGGVSEISVRPFSAMRRYGSLDQDPAAAGRELGVDAVLDGSMQRVGGRIRVTARLIRTSDGVPLWVRTFDENVSDIFALQDSISEQVVGSLIPELATQARSHFGTRGTDNADAYQLYLRGRYFWNKRTKESLKNAIEYFGRALTKDPGYALAYSGIADCYIIRHDLPPHDRMPKARDAATKALQINPNLGEAHLSLARVKGYYEWDRPGAERELRTAIQIDSRSADAYRTLAIQLMWVRRFDEAENANRRAQELDPLSVTVNKQAAWLAFHRRQYDKAIALYRSVLELDPHFAQAQREIGLAYLQAGQYQEAHHALRTALEQPENYFKSTTDRRLGTRLRHRWRQARGPSYPGNTSTLAERRATSIPPTLPSSMSAWEIKSALLNGCGGPTTNTHIGCRGSGSIRDGTRCVRTLDFERSSSALALDPSSGRGLPPYFVWPFGGRSPSLTGVGREWTSADADVRSGASET